MSQFKRKLSAFATLLAFVSFTGVQAVSAEGSIHDNTFLGGSSGFEQYIDGNTQHINNTTNQAGGVAMGDFGQFNSAKGETIQYGFSNISQLLGIRVLGGDPSKFYGHMQGACIGNVACSSYAQTGKVFIINPAGIMFGEGSTVDLNSFTASTFDIKGAKNFKDMTDAEKAVYEKTVLNPMSSNAAVNGAGRNYGVINFDSNYTEAFKKAGIDLKPGSGQIILDGTTFAHFNEDGTLAGANPNKSVAIVSDNIVYKDSLIRTGDNFNYITNKRNKSFSNVRLITADCVTFNYLANGYDDTYKVADDTKTDVTRNITMDNSGLADKEVAIKSGDVHIVNQSNAAGSNIKIAIFFINKFCTFNNRISDFYV